MRWGKRWLVAAGLAVILAGLGGSRALASGYGPRVDIWTDKGTGGMYRAGQCVEIHIRPDEDCYVIVYDIDTEGYLRVLFPRDCYDDCYLAGGRTYTLGGGYRTFYAQGPSGIEYIHVVASCEPFRQIYWDGCDGYEAYVREVSWRGFHDYYGSALPPRVYGDPYIAMQTIDEFICADGLEAGLVWADFTYFYVGERVHYPRYLCYDCHGFGSCVRPYVDICVGFSVSFVDCDPCYRPWSWWWWCRPERVYCGPRFVCHWTGRHVCDRSCERGHGGDHGSTDVCKDDRGRWPSEYKWKSRAEDRGARAPQITGGAVIRGGNIVDGARVRNVEGRDKSIYTRSEVTRPVPETRKAELTSTARSARDRVVRESAVRESAVRQHDRQRDSEPRGDTERNVERAKTRVAATGARESQNRVEIRSTERHRSEPSRAERSAGQSEIKRTGRGSSLMSSIVKHLTKSTGSPKQDAKGTKPQVRRGDEGKSRATRRTLSR